MLNARLKKRVIDLSYALLGHREHRCFHTSFILKKARVLAIGLNQIKTHPQTQKLGYAACCGLHSELDACLKLGLPDCSDFTLVNVRIDGQHQVNMSKPCRFCQGLIKRLNFKNVYYTDEKGEFISFYETL